ncbi:MAG: 4'-phosphopantetheinyl transferase superfamily protein [Candidatus Delongbacteria bacterium]
MTSDLHGDEARLRELVGVGCDTEERARLERTLERDSGFLERWFLPLERQALGAAPDPVGLALQLFCLKEAAIKALWAQHQVGPDSVECRWSSDAGWSLRLLPGRRGLQLEGQAGLEGDLGWARVLAWQGPEARTETGRDSSRPALGFGDQGTPETLR